MSPTEPDLTVIVPVAERPMPLRRIVETYHPPLAEAGIRCEFIFVVEPSFSREADELRAAPVPDVPVEILLLGQVAGESTLLKLGAERAQARLVLTLPPYHRVAAEGLGRLIEPLRAGHADLVVARRWPRRDSWLNRLQNRAYHRLLQPLGGDRFHDVACGVRAMRREVLMELPLYGDFHRFLPLVAHREGYVVEEMELAQHPEDRQARVYRPGTYLRRLIDILGIHFLLRFTEKPLRFFGLLGSVTAFAGIGILAVMVVQRFQGHGMADRPLLLLGALLVVLGAQAIALGLVGEMIVHLSAPTRKPYRLRGGSAPPPPE